MPTNESARATPKKLFTALIQDASQKRQKIQSISGELGARIKNAVEEANLNRAAFSLCRRLYDMEEDKRNDFLRSFDLYVDYCREEGLFGSEHVGDMFEDTGAAEDQQAEADAAHVQQNIDRLNGGIKTSANVLLDDIRDREFDDATAAKPSRRNRPRAGDGEAAGSYSVKS